MVAEIHTVSSFDVHGGAILDAVTVRPSRCCASQLGEWSPDRAARADD
jgi:hypothetical protein